MTYDDFVQLVMTHEGTGPMKDGCHLPYKDSVGKLTVGYGRNLEDNPLTEVEARYLLENDLGRARSQARRAFPWFDLIDPTAQNVVTELCFNMGIGKYETFHEMHAALSIHDYPQAASCLLDSLYAKQVGKRANDLASLLRTISSGEV